MNWKIPAYRLKKLNKASLVTPVAFLTVSVLLCVLLGFGCFSLNKKQKMYEAEKQKYEDLIAKEEARKEEIAEYATYTKTTAYYEEVAREKYRLVHDNEILFVME